MVKALDISDISRSILHVLSDDVSRTAMEINVCMGCGVRPIRRALSQLMEFKLIESSVNDRRFKVFGITGDGKQIVDELHPKPKEEVSVKPSINSHMIYDEMKQSKPNIASWLRMQAESFLIMAKQLETDES